MKQPISSNELNFDDIFDLWLPSWWESPWVWCAMCVAILSFIGLFFLVRYLYKLYKIKKQSPLDVALHRMVLLTKSVQNERAHETFNARGKEFYTELSLVIKQYFDGEHGLHASSKTDTELYWYLKTGDTSKIPEIAEWVGSVNTLVERGMCIKFGCGISDRSTFLNECEKVHNILIKTSQREKRA